jgi:hypothetical protein
MCNVAARDARRHIGGDVARFFHPKNLDYANDNWREAAEDKGGAGAAYIDHYVNVLDDTVVDYTGSQFWGSGTPTPLVEPLDVYKSRCKTRPDTVDDPGEYFHGNYRDVRRETDITEDINSAIRKRFG